MLPPEVEPSRKPLIFILIGLAVLLIAGFITWYLTVYVADHVAQQQAQSIQKQITGPVKNTGQEGLKADVASTVIAVQTYIGTHGAPTDYSVIPVVKSSPDETVTITGGNNMFTITGIYIPTGFTYVYDSATGRYR